ncbi:S-adenosyl-L-methionine-dependent methyltransferase [Lasiosphaeria hispida]|uniref:S-adenosyl-L-methionine-dependent methyltransferase n=1 Tax=Lasiosphaeria hispida TaxID=260671 RepID=A0AAJ0H5X9_9PEZI|nr:S-adenosyl-L-methionine-dependent methyltransferase [Lasiosphaeria hispida]
MTNEKKDTWSSEAYQHSASFVPKLATKILQWLDPQKDDVILDIGCGDGVLDVQIGQILAQGQGRLHGVDSSAAMINASTASIASASLEGKCTFEVIDATDLVSKAELQKQEFTKVFSNAAMHWILRPEERREVFFRGVKEALAPGGHFVFEMGGLGNVCEVRAAVLTAVGRRIGLAKARAIEPWFFPDEEWARKMMEETVGGFEIEKIEREWRPTTADEGGIKGWVRLMVEQVFQALSGDAAGKEACIREVIDVLEIVCAKPGGGYMFSYVRLRVAARKL